MYVLIYPAERAVIDHETGAIPKFVAKSHLVRSRTETAILTVVMLQVVISTLVSALANQLLLLPVATLGVAAVVARAAVGKYLWYVLCLSLFATFSRESTSWDLSLKRPI
jgi:hypothetical protein